MFMSCFQSFPSSINFRLEFFNDMFVLWSCKVFSSSHH